MVYPFGTGQCLTTLTPCARSRYILVSIPLEQGNVLRPTKAVKDETKVSLNPFGTGQCLTTVVGS